MTVTDCSTVKHTRQAHLLMCPYHYGFSEHLFKIADSLLLLPL